MPDSTAVAPPTVTPAGATAPRGGAPPLSSLPPLHFILDRPRSQRLQEFRYRFGQSVVFGLPVIALQWFGRSLGGAESDRWVTLFQLLLAGWVVYVGAAGMLAEGVLLLLARRRPDGGLFLDFIAALAAVGLYLLGLSRLVPLLAAHAAGTHLPATLHWAVIGLALWTGLRAWHASAQATARLGNR